MRQKTKILRFLMSVQLASENLSSSSKQPTQNNSSCTVNICCGQKNSWRDVVMFTLEGGTGTASIASFILTQNPYLGGGLAALTLVTGVVHCLWRRDATVADLHRVVVDIGQTEHQIEGTVEKTAQIVTKLREENSTLSQEKKALFDANAALEHVKLDLSNQVSTLQVIHGKMENENKQLIQQNQILKDQISRLQNIVKTVKEHLCRFNEQNTALKEKVDKFGEKVSEFNKEDQSLQQVFSGFDKDLGIEIKELTQEVDTAQKTSREIFGLFAGNIQKFQDEIKSLQSKITAFNAEDENIQKRTQKLTLLQEKVIEAEKALKLRQGEFDTINQQLMIVKSDLETALNKYGQIESKISTDTTQLKNVTEHLADIAEHLDQLGSRIEKDINDLKQIDATTKKQEEEINNL